MIFQHFTPQSHIIYKKLELVILYTALSERKMEVENIPISKLQDQKGISLMLKMVAETTSIRQIIFANLLKFLIDNIFVHCIGSLFRHVFEIPVGANCAPLLAEPFLYSYENES